MTELEQVHIAKDAIMTYYSTDDPEIKAYVLGINAGVSPEAVRIHREATVIDTCSFYLESYNWHLKESGATALNLTVPQNLAGTGSAVNSIIDHYEAIANNSDHFLLAETADDIRTAKKEGKIAMILGAQNPRFVEHANLEASTEAFARLGMRIIQIGYNQRTFATDGCLCETDGGLSPMGRKLIQGLEKAGITVDLSHISPRSAMEAMDVCTKTPIFSHSNPRKLFDHPRNISDEAAKKCADMGGVIGVCSYLPILWNHEHLPCIDDFVDAIAYYGDLVGIDHVGIGIDSNAEPSAYDRHDTRHLMELNHPNRDVYLAAAAGGRGKRSAFPEGLHSLANIVNIVDHMLKRGFSEADIKKVMGENYLRVFEQTWRKK
ncbi:dipeptidase [Oscillibacter sp. MSJ-2]|uniref:Dipeptidase n=1 Tax=Dysosmobacter acutus TaxID=2841504 RepID=A0ABS6F918_9FIRM|nr:membrane dipeptidase [Dysosmobacter acutus]MBU5625855.1 dipeptidase [Dysosmobacter acutus]